LPETSTAVQRPSLKQVLLYRGQAWNKYCCTEAKPETSIAV